jgi:hypothetical protein
MNAPLNTRGIIVSLLRASAMVLAFACPGSIRDTEIRINESNEAADAGTAAHKCSELLPTHGAIDWDNIDRVALEHGVDCNELRFLCGRAQTLWNQGKIVNGDQTVALKDCFPGAMTEVGVEHTLEISGLKLTGTLDGVTISGDVARCYDWKFGRLDNDYYHQMMAYASMILLEFPTLREVTITILWARDLDVENYTVTQGKARAWMKRVEDEVINWDGVYRPSEKCVHCPRSYECPAFNALARRDVAVLLDVPTLSLDAQLAAMHPDAVIALERQAKLVNTVSGKAREAIHDLVKKRGEIIGTEAKLVVANEPRREINPVKAWAIIERFGFDEDDWAKVCKIGVTKLEKRIAEKAGRGNGAAAKRKLGEQLEQCGAVQLVDCLIVKERRV